MEEDVTLSGQAKAPSSRPPWMGYLTTRVPVLSSLAFFLLIRRPFCTWLVSVIFFLSFSRSLLSPLQFLEKRKGSVVQAPKLSHFIILHPRCSGVLVQLSFQSTTPQWHRHPFATAAFHWKLLFRRTERRNGAHPPISFYLDGVKYLSLP
ncbi:hypothetical protein QBC42DRAFT_28647 [Cladorrhinum samala]|uniref:Uncharacterized protein n=1 Tax=Cladorrhinum samala TaxID=585594 RepID=A0AAV9HER8_9PEZI|nr:hypothetical protein QBC42DRAFT_28647 [Cladorrhinum samala]